VTCECRRAFYAFPNVSAHLAEQARACQNCTSFQLSAKAHLALVPAKAFGAPGYLGWPTPTSIERIDEGLAASTFFFAR